MPFIGASALAMATTRPDPRGAVEHGELGVQVQMGEGVPHCSLLLFSGGFGGCLLSFRLRRCLLSGICSSSFNRTFWEAYLGQTVGYYKRVSPLAWQPIRR